MQKRADEMERQRKEEQQRRQAEKERDESIRRIEGEMQSTFNAQKEVLEKNLVNKDKKF